jgi:hypothetical protein
LITCVQCSHTYKGYYDDELQECPECKNNYCWDCDSYECECKN